ncbi:class I adenylate-forming enzyme family protein [Dactylosporangium matsuzakiense]|uniref:Acyl-CoA synthetase n=2 Tax=Dactylosporangium matsuzakiense TaxID=53360 RepID=A0A9W6NNX6_9ACTN|nr:class I adenylate-forming enzyme family protein [Dactylosporangium matsuzakiense]GLL03492.1 acyl-CoA synthetase [Dactylosporangium matsuzakiense]
MYLLGTHRSIAQRMRLFLRDELGAGNFFWHAYDVADDRSRPLIFHPDVTAPDWDTREVPGLSLDDLRDRALRLAAWYRDQGVDSTARVGVYTRNGLLGLVHHIAVTGLGAAAVHCNPRMAAPTAADYFQRTQCALVVGDGDGLERVTDAWAASGAAELPTANVQELDKALPAPRGPLAGFPYRHGPDELVMISHSSGTTGRPKAPVFAHGSFFVGKRERLLNYPSLRSDRLLSALPHSHSAGISYLSLAIMLGLPTMILDEPDGPGVARAVNAFRPTIVLGFPLTLAEVDPAGIEPAAAQGVHTWNGMGDASHERHIRPLIALGQRPGRNGPVPGSRYLDGLGSSEMGMVLFRQAHTPESSAYGRRIGRPVGVVRKAAALRPDGSEAGPGEAGLLGVRTPSVTPGYWDDPALTQRSMLNGYFLTGDVARRDAEGNWFHLDRIPDVIPSVHGPVYSLPIEEIVLNETGALDTAVIATDDPDNPGFSAPIAIVLFRAGVQPAKAPDAAVLLERCNAALRDNGLAVLRRVLVAAGREDLPVGVTGKVLKRELRDRHRALLCEAGA